MAQNEERKRPLLLINVTKEHATHLARLATRSPNSVQFDVVFHVGRYMREAIAWDYDGVPSLEDWRRRPAEPHELVEFAREYGAAGMHEAVGELEMAEKAQAAKGCN